MITKNFDLVYVPVGSKTSTNLGLAFVPWRAVGGQGGFGFTVGFGVRFRVWGSAPSKTSRIQDFKALDRKPQGQLC